MVNVYYWNNKPNFGDLLAPLLLKRFCKLSSSWAPVEDSQIILAGSILDKVPSDWSGIIAGAGKLHEKTVLNFPEAKILAVRGPLTAKGLRGNFVLGDPGLLADELIGPQNKIYNLGLVPHWTDVQLANDPRFLKYNPKIINVSDDPLTVIRQISQCRKIVSSSLHGIILADAYNIPRRIEIAPRMLTHMHQEGGLFKWRDYSLSLGQELEIGVTREVDRNIIVDKQHELFDVMEEVKTLLGGR